MALLAFPPLAMAQSNSINAADPKLTVRPKLRADTPIAPPSYPPSARSERVEGEVTLGLCVTTDGEAERVRVLTSAGDSRLDQAAAEWALALDFEPGRTAAGVVEVCGHEVVVNWSLDDAPASPLPAVDLEDMSDADRRRFLPYAPIATVDPDVPPRLGRFRLPPEVLVAGQSTPSPIEVAVCIAEDGSVRSAQSVSSSGDHAFDLMVLQALTGARLLAAQKNGAAIGVCGFLIEFGGAGA